jgi:hypothetical protein
VTLVKTDVSGEIIPSIIRVKRISELGKALEVWLVTVNVFPSSLILITLMMVVIRSSDTSVRPRATRSYIPEDDILHSYCRENLKSYIVLTDWTM